MVAPGPVRRFLPYGILSVALTFAAPAPCTSAVLSPAAGAAAPPGYDEPGGASLEYVHWGRFCRWYRHHGLCRKLIEVRRFCDRHPSHRFCDGDDDDDDRFCRKHPRHRKCDDKPPSPS